MDDFPAEAGFKPVQAVKRMARIRTGRNGAHIVGEAPFISRQPDGVPVQGVGSHQIPPLAGGGAVQIQGLASRNNEDSAGEDIRASGGQKKNGFR